MRTARAVAFVSLLSVIAVDARAAAPDAAALGKLEAARANLASAVQRIKQDPPSTVDLDAAHAAVGALKDAIDAGADNEQIDLDYAKAALAARKELRTQREYVDQRRAMVYLFNHRRTIDAALKDLNDRARRVEGKTPSGQDFEDVRAAIREVRKAVEPARQFTGQDEKFASYVAEVDANLARQERALDDRQARLNTDKQRKLLEESRKALSTSMSALGKGASDAQFKNADIAAAALAERLEEGETLEPKDKTYRSDADRARSELAQAKKRMDELWSAQGLARLKAEIEPSFKDLVTAAQALRAKDPTADQLAEAKTAAFVVRKLVEKFQPEASRSQAFAEYVGGVKKTLIEVEVELQRRSLTSARAAVTDALRPIERRAPTEEQFKSAEAALAGLEKTLQAIPEPDTSIASRVADARALLQTGRATVAKRRTEADLETAQAEVVKSLRPLERKAPTDEQFKEASTALTILEKTLETVQKKDAPQAVAEAQALLRDAKATWAKRHAEVSLGSAQAAVVRALRPLEKRVPTDEQFKEAGTAVTVLEKTLETVKPKDAPQVVADAKARLRDAKATVAKRRAEVSLESAKAGVAEALRPIEGKNPTDEQFKEVNTSLTILEKTLESMSSKDAPAAYVDAKGLLRSARATVTKRRVQIDVELQRARVEKERIHVAQALSEIQQPDAGNKQLQEATAAVQQLQKDLDAGTALTKQDKEYAWYDHEVRKRVAQMNERIAKRKIELAASDGRALLSDKLGEAKSKLEAAKQPQATDGDVGGASKSVDGVGQALEERTSLEVQDPHYAANAAKAREELDRLKQDLEFVKQAHALRQRILGDLSAGTSTSNSAAAIPDIRAQKAQYEKALTYFRSCEEAESLFEKNRALANIGVLVDGRISSPKDAVGLCLQRSQATRKLLGQVEALIAFEEGPRRAYEKAKDLLAKSKKSEALEQFGECIATGRILQQRNPELTDRKFQVAGTRMTLGEVIKQCTDHRDALQPKR